MQEVEQDAFGEAESLCWVLPALVLAGQCELRAARFPREAPVEDAKQTYEVLAMNKLTAARCEARSDRWLDMASKRER